MPDLGDRCLPALAAALRALVSPGPGGCERALAAFADPVGLDVAAFLEPSAIGFVARGTWLRERGAPREGEVRLLPPRWLEALTAGELVRAPAGEPAPIELRPLRLAGAPALLAAPARGDGLVGVLVLAAQAPRFTWSKEHEQAASALAAGLAAALLRADEATAVLDSLPQRVAWKDAALRYRGCNRAFARAAGQPAAQLAGRDDRELALRPEVGERGDLARKREREALATGHPQLARLEATASGPGREQWHLVSRIPQLGPDGRPVGLVVVSEDVGERVQAAAMLRHAERTLAVARLSAALSADLQPALAEIEAASADDRVRDAARGATDLLRQLAAFARRQLAEPVDVAPAPLIAGMRGLVARVLGARVALELPAEGVRSVVRADPRQLEQLVVALARHLGAGLGADARFAVDVGPQSLGLDRALASGLAAGEYVRLSFRAGPIGHVSPDMTSETHADAWLELARTIARNAGGALRTDGDAVARTVEILLPRVFSLPRPPEGGAPPDLRGAERLLVLHDDLHLRMAIAAVLRQLGFQVHIAEDADEALTTQRDVGAPLALALIAADLPAGALEAARALQRGQPDLRVLVLARQGGGDGLVVPCTFEALAARVRQALDARQT